MCSMRTSDKLRNGYLDIVKTIDASYIIPNNQKNRLGKDLSGLFLTSVHPNYDNAENKIMIIGRETKAWKWNEATDVELVDQASCVDQALKSHQIFFRSIRQEELTRVSFP